MLVPRVVLEECNFRDEFAELVLVKIQVFLNWFLNWLSNLTRFKDSNGSISSSKESADR